MTRRPRRRWPVFVVLVAAAVGLIVADQKSSPTSPIGVAARTWMGVGVGPAQELASGVGDGVQALRRAGQALGGNQGATVARLEQENSALKAEVNTASFDRTRVSELDALLHTAGLGQYRIVPARVVAFGAAGGFSRSVTIDVGSLDGITANETVLAAQGLVGRVTSVAQSTSTVALLIDATTTVGVRLENQQAGYATGGGAVDQPLAVDLFNPAAQVNPGMRMVTFGSPDGKPYVPGVPVGTVTSVEGLTGQLTKRVQVHPFVDFAALDLVGVVVQPPRTNPRMAVLPPRPTSTPPPVATVTVTVTAPAGGPQALHSSTPASSGSVPPRSTRVQQPPSRTPNSPPVRSTPSRTTTSTPMAPSPTQGAGLP